ncbi:MAG: hypothetical protein Q9217_005988 [Psora testacea]
MSITEGQRQALIDNLQLEGHMYHPPSKRTFTDTLSVTERARKLRAQYALQAQSLRTRVELRVNRIPTALRKANMGELFSKYEERQQEKAKVPTTEEQKAVIQNDSVLEAQPITEARAPKPMQTAKAKGTKRNSDTMRSAAKENIAIHEDLIANPKKRTKVAQNAATRQPPNPSTVLSPKSANSRTLPQSPVRPTLGSPQKSFNSHPASPLKPMVLPAKIATASLTSMVTEKAKPGRPKAGAGKTAAKRAAASRKKPEAERKVDSEGLRTVSSTSNSSAMSTGTTIVKNVKKGPSTTAKKGMGGKAAGKKVPVAPDAPAAGRRVLRKR